MRKEKELFAFVLPQPFECKTGNFTTIALVDINGQMSLFKLVVIRLQALIKAESGIDNEGIYNSIRCESVRAKISGMVRFDSDS